MEITMESRKRNLGIDLLKIVSMFLIVTLHILTKGGGGVKANSDIIGHQALRLLETICYVAVNCYALSSGFVLSDKKIKYFKLVQLWLEVVFYSLGFMFIYGMFSGDLEIREIIQELFPISTVRYWYFTAYTGVFILAPIMNCAIKSLSKKEIKTVLVIGMLFLSVLSTMWGNDAFAIRAGYSTGWLCFLYILGAAIKTYGVAEIFNKWKWIAIYFLLILSTWVGGNVLEYVDKRNLLLSYTSPTILGASIGLFCGFITIEIRSELMKKIIVMLSSMTFGVYLIHDNQYISYFLMNTVLSKILNFVEVNLLLVLLYAIIIFILSLGIEVIRNRIFQFGRGINLKRFVK